MKITDTEAWLKAHVLKITAGTLLVIAVILAAFDRVWADARGSDGGVRQELAEGISPAPVKECGPLL